MCKELQNGACETQKEQQVARHKPAKKTIFDNVVFIYAYFLIRSCFKIVWHGVVIVFLAICGVIWAMIVNSMF